MLIPNPFFPSIKAPVIIASNGMSDNSNLMILPDSASPDNELERRLSDALQQRPRPITTGDASISSNRPAVWPTASFEEEFKRWNDDGKGTSRNFPDYSISLQAPMLSDPRASGHPAPSAAGPISSAMENPGPWNEAQAKQSSSVQGCNGYNAGSTLGSCHDYSEQAISFGNPQHCRQILYGAGQSVSFRTPFHNGSAPRNGSVLDNDEAVTFHARLWGPVTICIYTPGHENIRNLVAQSKAVYDFVNLPFVNDSLKTMALYQEMTSWLSPIFIHFTEKDGFWLVPAVQDSRECTPLVAYLMWRTDNRWTVTGIGQDIYKGALLVTGPLWPNEQLELGRNQYPGSLALFGTHGQPIPNQSVGAPAHTQMSPTPLAGHQTETSRNNGIQIDNITGKPNEPIKKKRGPYKKRDQNNKKRNLDNKEGDPSNKKDLDNNGGPNNEMESGNKRQRKDE